MDWLELDVCTIGSRLSDHKRNQRSWIRFLAVGSWICTNEESNTRREWASNVSRFSMLFFYIILENVSWSQWNSSIHTTPYWQKSINLLTSHSSSSFGILTFSKSTLSKMIIYRNKQFELMILILCKIMLYVYCQNITNFKIKYCLFCY